MHFRDGEPLDEDQLKALIEGEIQTSVGWLGGKISEDREKAMDYYYGEPFGNELEGRSQFVSTDVQDVIESVMPDFIEIFASGEVVVEFNPVGPEDEEAAKQATEYVNYVWNENDGFEVVHDWIKDALLQKVGIIKIEWDATPQTRIETLTRLNVLQLQQFLNDKTVEILEQGEVEPESEEDFAHAQGYPLFDLKIKKTFSRGRVVVMNVPPDEFFITRQTVSLDDAPFKMHKTQKTYSELVEMGFDRDLIEDLPSHDEEQFSTERQNRFQQEEWLDDDLRKGAMRKIWLYDIYLKVDYDGDGIAELRNVLYAGNKILENEVADDHPFVDITPVRMPHVFFGRSLAELMFDIQYIKSSVIRQILDNMYLVNNGRSAVSRRVSLEDYLTNRPGGVVRVDTDGDVGGHIFPLVTQPIINHALPVVEFIDGVREVRTGQTRYNQGLDADSLNKTATGINLLLNEAQKRKLLMARLFAETGFKKAMRKILRLVINNQDQARVVRLRNKWVEIDPRAWNAEMDLSVRVGLGFGTKESRLGMLERIMAMVERIVTYQGGIQGPLVTLEHIHKLITEYINHSGFKPASLFIDNPEGKELPPPPPNPDVEKAKMDAQLKAQSMQMDDARKKQEIMLEHQRGLLELELKAKETGVEIDLKREKQNAELAMSEFEKFGQEGPQSSQLLEGFQGVAQALMEAAQAMRQAAEINSRPKEVVRENGKVVGVRIVG